MNNLRNVNQIFRKNVAYDNIKSHKKERLQPFSLKETFGRITEVGGGGVKLTHPSFLKLKNRPLGYLEDDIQYPPPRASLLIFEQMSH